MTQINITEKKIEQNILCLNPIPILNSKIAEKSIVTNKLPVKSMTETSLIIIRHKQDLWNINDKTFPLSTSKDYYIVFENKEDTIFTMETVN